MTHPGLNKADLEHVPLWNTLVLSKDKTVFYRVKDTDWNGEHPLCVDLDASAESDGQKMMKWYNEAGTPTKSYDTQQVTVNRRALISLLQLFKGDDVTLRISLDCPLVATAFDGEKVHDGVIAPIIKGWEQ